MTIDSVCVIVLMVSMGEATYKYNKVTFIRSHSTRSISRHRSFDNNNHSTSSYTYIHVLFGTAHFIPRWVDDAHIVRKDRFAQPSTQFGCGPTRQIIYTPHLQMSNQFAISQIRYALVRQEWWWDVAEGGVVVFDPRSDSADIVVLSRRR